MLMNLHSTFLARDIKPTVFLRSFDNIKLPILPMASNSGLKMLAALALAMAIFVQGSLGEILCEKLDKDACAFAVSASGKRCVLEKQVKRSGEEAYSCGTSEIKADKLKNLIETDQCIKACGLDRNSLGISSDSLLDSNFTKKLCSSQCSNNCPNIADLFFNLAAGEGVFLPKLCEALGANARRGMSEIRSSGIAARRGLLSEIKSSGIAAPGPIYSIKATTFSAPAMPPY